MSPELLTQQEAPITTERKQQLITFFEGNVMAQFPTIDATILQHALDQLAEAETEDELRSLGVQFFEGFKVLEGTQEEEENETTAEELADAADLVEEELRTINQEEALEAARETLGESYGDLVADYQAPEAEVVTPPEPPKEKQREEQAPQRFFQKMFGRFFGSRGEQPATQGATETEVQYLPAKEAIRAQYEDAYARETDLLAAIFDDQITELGYEAEIGISQFVQEEDAAFIDHKLAELGYLMAGDTNTVPEFTKTFFKAPMADGSFQYRLLVTPQERLEDLETTYKEQDPIQYNAELRLREALSLVGDSYKNRLDNPQAQYEQVMTNPLQIEDENAYEFTVNGYLNREALTMTVSLEAKNAVIDILQQQQYKDKDENEVNVNEDAYYEVNELDDGRFFIEVRNIQEQE